MRAVNASQMRRIDRQAQRRFGIPELILMEHAGTAVAHEIGRLLRSRKRKGIVLILAGGGANGGDGFVTARHLHNWGIPVEVVLLGHRDRIGGSAQTNLEILRRLRVRVKLAHTPAMWKRWSWAKRSVGLIVDALLGTGISGEIREPIRSAIAWINQQSCPVISVDLPSGLSSDSGLSNGVAVRATATVTCGLPKVGLMKREGKRLSGRVKVADISLPKVLR